MKWYEEFGFEADPYEHIDPPKIPFTRLGWNRSDLSSARTHLDMFLEDVSREYRTALVAYGAIGSGKTWLSRIIEKEFTERVPDGVTFRTKVFRLSPDFDTVYKLFVDSLLSEDRFFSKAKEKIGDTQSKWAEYFKSPDLGNAMFHIALGDDKEAISKNWLRSNRVSSGELREASISLQISGSAAQYEAMRNILDASVSLFPSTLLIVDELENASTAFAGKLADVLREILDSFTERIALCCFYTGQSLDEWYDNGYTEVLLSRLSYKIPIASIEVSSAANWLTQHNALYRAKDKTPEDQLSPFTKDGLNRLL